ncbi:MAG: hypothetical protein V2I46_12480 [Bacteroides sp.]|jgi:hypothetical protein|nr:hypothetical protein [Bacteroides sp.]
MQLIEVNNSRTVKEFLEVPRIIYKNDPNWISHLDQDIEAVFDPRKNKYFILGEAIRWVLKDDNGQLLGRVAAFIHPEFSAIFNQPTGGMGFFECTNNQQAADILFHASKNWLAQKGMEAMDGPINFGEKDRFWGLLVNGFENQPIYTINYNPPYYKDLFEHYGFKKFYNQNVFYLSASKGLPPILEKKYERLITTQGYRFGHLEVSKIDKYAEDFKTIYNEAWAHTHKFFKPISKDAALAIFESIKSVVDEKLVIFAYHYDRPVAFFVSIPELNQIFKHLNGRLDLWGKIKFLYYRWRGKLNQISGLVFGIVPEYRNKGLDAGMIMTLKNYIVTGKKTKYKGAYMAWIGDFNPKMVHIAEHIGGERVFLLTTYRLMFNPNAEFEPHPVLD